MDTPFKREQARRHLRIPIKVQILDGDHWGQPEWAINLSAGGLGLQARRPRERGERLTVRFKLTPVDPPIELEAEAVWCAQEEDLTPGMHYYEMGLRFVEVPKHALRALCTFVDNEAHFWPDEDTLIQV
jgi:hypothetical protein